MILGHAPSPPPMPMNPSIPPPGFPPFGMPPMHGMPPPPSGSRMGRRHSDVYSDEYSDEEDDEEIQTEIQTEPESNMPAEQPAQPELRRSARTNKGVKKHYCTGCCPIRTYLRKINQLEPEEKELDKERRNNCASSTQL